MVLLGRLQVEQDPMHIVNSGPNQVVYIALQFCPIQETFYLAVGGKDPQTKKESPVVPDKGKKSAKNMKEESTAEVTSTNDSPSWFVDKV